MKIFDTHCHYNLEPLYESWQDHWQKAQSEGVERSIVVGTSTTTSAMAVEIAAADPHLYAAIGIHPSCYAEEPIPQLLEKNGFESCLANIEDDLRELAGLTGDRIVAVGETGLDYFHLNKDETLSAELKTQIVQLQKEAFTRHVQFAQEKNLPLIIHVRDTAEQAYWDVLKVLKTEKFVGSFILHCISGPTTYVEEALKLGAYIGVAANVTYKSADHIRQLASLAPKDRVLLETDAPFLPPQEFRGKVCQPWMIRKTAEFLEQNLGLTSEALSMNALHFFALK